MMNSKEIRGKLLLGGEQAVQAIADLLKNKVVVVATSEGKRDMMQSFNVKENEDIKREFFSDDGLSINLGRAVNKLSAQGSVVYRLKWSGDKECSTFSCKLDELKLYRQKKIAEKIIDILVTAGVITRDRSSELIGMDISELRAYMLGLDYHEKINGDEYWSNLFIKQLEYINAQYEIVVV